MGALQSETSNALRAPEAQANSRNQRIEDDLQAIARDGGWEFCSMLAGCAVSAMAAFSGGSVEDIGESLRASRLALLEAIAALRDLEKIEGTP